MKSKSNLIPSISILLVEDEKDNLELLAIILTKKFPDVVLYTAANGKSGLELFKTQTPDIVITDINMPEMCGVKMAYKIRAINPDIKFIAITGNTGKYVLEDSVEKDFVFDHNIVKPVDFSKLFAAIEQCLGKIAQ
jgi:two-component system cell cycle response regulator